MQGGESIVQSIREPQSCSYIITIATSHICKHGSFRKAPNPPVAISCYPEAHVEAMALDAGVSKESLVGDSGESEEDERGHLGAEEGGNTEEGGNMETIHTEL